MKIVAEGAEAVIYESEIGGIPALLKRRVQKRYRIESMDLKIRSSRSKNEARIIATVSKLGINAPKLLLFDRFDIYMSPIKGVRLTEVISLGHAKLAMFEEVGRALGNLHNANIVHGDYTPANIIIGEDGPYIIDFGLSGITSAIEDKALDILLMKRAIGKHEYALFIKGYENSARDVIGVLKRLESIERRGRYQTRTIS